MQYTFISNKNAHTTRINTPRDSSGVIIINKKGSISICMSWKNVAYKNVVKPKYRSTNSCVFRNAI